MRSATDAREKQLLEEVGKELPNAVLERFATLVRESGSEDERVAASFISERLQELGIPHRVHRPPLYLSLPRGASLKVTSPIKREVRAKTPAFSVSTGDAWVEGEMVHVPTGYASGIGDIFGGAVEADAANLEGKVILTEGFPMPGKVAQFSGLGVKAAVFVAPGERIHEGICTTIWGAPDLDNAGDEPEIPVLAVNKPDGDELARLCGQGPVSVEFRTNLEKGWYPCPLIDAFIEGTEEPERYVLLHGHLDSWHEGIGDNATGDAALVEMTRVLHEHRDALKRSVRIAIWPGHSYGRYAGSTWFADEFALDLEENCIAQVNCDSPGCRWATSYEHMMWMSETDTFCKEVISDVLGQNAAGTRPLRAGDYSFNNIGISSFFMLSSTMPQELVEEKGYYPVGGCGGNIEWHTEADTLDIADRDRLLRDIRLYTGAAYRAANLPVHPLDFRATVDQIEETLTALRERLDAFVDLDGTYARLRELGEALEGLYAAPPAALESARPTNDALLQIGRELVRVLYTSSGPYRQDPALHIPLLPDFAAAADAIGTVPDGVVRTELVRVRNRLDRALENATEAARRVG
jgi:N-acetylated-alpha-linked acidic dipeptidase